MTIVQIFFILVFQNHSIHNLDTFTQYLVSLQVFNPEGHGPASTVTVMTDEGGKCEREKNYFILFIWCDIKK